MMLTICFVRKGFEGMIGPPDPLVSMSQRIESTNLVRCKLNLKLGGGECVLQEQKSVEVGVCLVGGFVGVLLTEPTFTVAPLPSPRIRIPKVWPCGVPRLTDLGWGRATVTDRSG